MATLRPQRNQMDDARDYLSVANITRAAVSGHGVTPEEIVLMRRRGDPT